MQVQHSIENARMLIDQSYGQLELTWPGAQIQARKYLPFAEERYPQYVDKMRGLAEGANISFADVLTLNTMEAVTMDALHLTRCTSSRSTRSAPRTVTCWPPTTRTGSPRMRRMCMWSRPAPPRNRLIWP